MAKKKRGRGRPALPKSQKRRHMLNFKLDDAELKALDRKAKELGMTRSDLIREGVKKMLRV